MSDDSPISPVSSTAPARKRPATGALADYDVQQQIGHLLRKAQQRHLAIFNQNIADPQLTAVQFAVMSACRRMGPSSMSDLGKATAIDAATARGIIERLRARGLIALRTDATDRRKAVVELTQAGDQLLAEATPSAARISELTMADLNPVERVAVLFLLRKLAGDDSV